MVICQRCGRRPAQIQTQQIGPDGRPVFVNLCRSCFEDLRRSAGKTSSLDKFGKDLTAEAKEDKLDPVIGRQKEIERVIHILSRRTKNNPVLIGDPGVGKTAIVEGLAQKISQGRVPETLKGKRVVSLDLPLMLAGAAHRGEFEDRLKKVIGEVSNAKGQIILFIDELHMVVGAGAAPGAIDAANMLKPALARGELQAIGATTLDEYRQYIERDSALERRFQPILVDENTVEDTIAILEGLRPRYEEHHHVEIATTALKAAAELSDRYVSDRFLPDKAIDLVDEACAKVRLQAVREPENLKQVEKEIAQVKKQDLSKKDRENKLKELENVKKELVELWTRTKMEDRPVVTAKDIAGIVSTITKIPLEDLSEDERTKLVNLEKRIHKRIIGQDEAVQAIAEAIRRSRAGLKNPNRPIGSLMFLGPTGTGKTELSKALAEILYGSEDMLVRVDMSEYMEKHAVSRLIGAPPGYIGFERGGQLTEVVRRKPFSIILLDEIEKAHPEVFNILLQIMEDGRLTDGHGRTVDFKNTIIIMTSNAGTSVFGKETIGFKENNGSAGANNEEEAHQSTKQKVLDALKKTFRPEFLNRVDEVVVFKALTKKDLRQIVDLQLKQVNKLLAKQGITITVSTKAKNWLAEHGYDPNLGARPLRRLIQHEVGNKISDKIIAGEATKGAAITVDVGENKDLTVEVAQP